MSDHVVVGANGIFECQHCGDTYAVKLPILVDLWCAKAKWFDKGHNECEPHDWGKRD